MFDDYFNELDPVKRKTILDALQPEAGEEEALTQLRALFSLRYEPDRRIGYIDHFIGAISTLRDIAYNPGGRLSERKNTGLVQNAVHALCLDRGGEFSREILYRELCQLITCYIKMCRDDTHYQSVVLGLGRMSSDSLTGKIALDMQYLWETIVKYLGENEEYQVFRAAIADTAKNKLND
ncbi:MAG: hypothetical protein LIO56_02525 [Lachnospiraceae bacterium]|nr:hypothetical protein [Lachnospiraceae bacterium]